MSLPRAARAMSSTVLRLSALTSGAKVVVDVDALAWIEVAHVAEGGEDAVIRAQRSIVLALAGHFMTTTEVGTAGSVAPGPARA